MNMNVKPLGNRVIIEPKRKEEKTQGGIYLPESAQDSDNVGVVVAMSESIKDPQFNVGDNVMYEKYGGKEISDDNKRYIILDYKDVIARLRE